MLLATDSRNTVLAELKVGAANRLVYTPYGFQSAQQPVDATLGFNGQRRETPTGWYHLGNGYRVYNPVLRRFHAPDTLSPFGKGGLNAYAYCEGDPVNFTDPTGHFVPAMFTSVSLLENILDSADEMVGLLVRSRPHTVASRLKQVGYTMASAGAVMHTAGSSSGFVVGMAGGTLISAARVAERAPKLLQKLSSSRWGAAIYHRLVGQKAPYHPLGNVRVIKRNPELLTASQVDVIRSA